jgi:hypothetical protein
MAEDQVPAVQVLGPNQYLLQPLLPVTKQVLSEALGVAPFRFQQLPPWARLNATTSMCQLGDIYQERDRPLRYRALLCLVGRSDPSKLQR